MQIRTHEGALSPCKWNHQEAAGPWGVQAGKLAPQYDREAKEGTRSLEFGKEWER